jgi:UPF0755 protein
MEQPSPRRADRRHDPDRPHRGSLVALLATFLVLVSGVAAVGVYYGHCRGADDAHAPVTFSVEDGASGAQIVDQLAAKRVIRCGGIVGRLLLQKNGASDAIRAGTFQLTTGMTLDQAMTVLTSPPPSVPTVSITVPEGYRITQIASLVHHALKIPAAQFTARATRSGYSLPPYLSPRAPSAEGFLFPETYEFVKKRTTANDVIRKLLDQFAVEARSLPFANATALGLTPYQIVIVASMIEKEVKVDADRPLVAAVIYNRLSHDMTLGFDSTVAYIDPNPADGLTSADFKIHSPYNTRLSAGLPPTPIASPGRASLAAALSPAHTNDLYFLDCHGRDRLVFSSTYDQFLRDKAACLG